MSFPEDNSPEPASNEVDRRQFMKSTGQAMVTAAAISTGGLASAQTTASSKSESVASNHLFEFTGPDSLTHGPGWETLNPGYWQIKGNALRRRIKNYGDRARSTGFPFHYETHDRNGGVMSTDYDPSLPHGVIYRRDWKLEGNWTIRARFQFHDHVDVRREGDDDSWKMYQPGYSVMGLAFGAKSVFESYNKVRNAQFVAWTDNEEFGFAKKSGKAKQGGRAANLVDTAKLKKGDVVEMELTARPIDDATVELTATFSGPDGKESSVTQNVKRRFAEGYVGIVGRGLADFSVEQFEVAPGSNRQLQAGEVDCYTCYPLGDTLKQQNGAWHVRFVALFATDGKRAECDSPSLADTARV